MLHLVLFFIFAAVCVGGAINLSTRVSMPWPFSFTTP